MIIDNRLFRVYRFTISAVAGDAARCYRARRQIKSRKNAASRKCRHARTEGAQDDKLPYARNARHNEARPGISRLAREAYSASLAGFE